MKITEVKSYALRSPLDQPFAFSQGWVRQRSATLVEVVTDEGIVGWGEAFAQGLEPPEIARAVIESALQPLVIGADPLDTEVLWHRMYHQTRDYGRKGSVVAAISAIDIALWDIAGKVRGVPTYRLLGGAFRTRVQAYATGFYRIRGQGEASRLGEEAVRHYEAGLTAMKVKLGYGVDDDIAVMGEVTRALGERSVTLMVDTNHAYGVAEAIRLGRALEPYHLRWYEEPVVPEDIAGYREVRQALSIPIAGGENEHTLFGFRELLGQRAVDIAQPDIGSAGGFTACRHILALAQAHGVQVNPHVWGSAIAQAASLQLIAAIPVAHHSVFAAEPIFEYDRSAHPFRQHLVEHPIQHVNGWLEIPSGPGLGVTVDRSVIDRYRV
ncbi:MAG: mandelate racemase/muconate lactonizing enzyme family protein [candidate division NC10 bacterium]|nr:mandelate racemase/muconate lactonizing enzyme family protein [candidate division NC10 bacterium]